MKILKKNGIKEIVIGLVLLGILVVIFITNRMNNRVLLTEETITNTNENKISMYVKDENGEVVGKDGSKYKQLGTEERMPSERYTINEENSYCYKESKENLDSNVRLYTNEFGEHVISNLSKNDKCYLYFDKKATIVSTIVGDKEVKPSTGGMFNVSDGTTTTGVLYEAEDDDGVSRYYRGNPSDNWVKFGTDTSKNQPIWWRIIRINGDGSIRMIYAGTGTSAPSTTGTGTQIANGSTTTFKFNTNYNNNMYVGYWYTSGEVHGLGTASTIYEEVNDWYSNTTRTNLASLQKDYIDEEAGFCNDRMPYSSTSGAAPTAQSGKGTTTTYYAAYIRLDPDGKTVTPTFKCEDKTNDLFTYSGATQGNHKLANPVGLITADEVSYAGVVRNSSTTTTTNYLYTNEYYWTMSPSSVDSSRQRANMFRMNSGGYLVGSYVTVENGVRPVINLKSSVTLEGSGTREIPYTVS